MFYKELNRILSEDGVKKSIISGIIKPINHFISENVKKMLLPFEVKLDETFTAEIKSLGSVIEHDSLSTGETKKINIAILIAYLKLIRTKKHINILFLDEVFSSIDLEGIDSILLLLKSFANDYNINIFVVHHAILSEEMFDRILKINKEVFTSIEEVNFEL
jgi:ABC-type multidrug transport system ATPase subunit